MIPDIFWIGMAGGQFVLQTPSVREFLVKTSPDALAGRLRQILREYPERPLRLILDTTLPGAWHAASWEKWLAGLPCPVQILRHSPTEERPGTAAGRTLLLSRWPKPKELKPLNAHSAHLRIRTGPATGTGLATMALEGPYHSLIFLAHGGEQPGESLLDEYGQPWQFQLPQHLPALVMFLVCEGQGSLDELARQALARGARCVVTASGRLDFQRTLAWLHDWLENRPPFAGWLMERLNDGAAGGPRSLRLWGEATDAIPPWRAELDRLERQAMREGKSPSFLLEQARPCSDSATPAWLNEVAASASSLPDRQRGWLLPYLLHCAERHDHRLGKPLQKALKDLPKASRDSGPWSAYHECADHRRNGRYPQACSMLAPLLAPSALRLETLEFQAAALGMLLNLLLDLDLPDCADRVEKELAITLSSGNCMDEREFEKLDRDARLWLRRGNFPAARRAYAQKRTQAQDKGEKGLRELAGLMNAAAWWQAPKASELAEECALHLQSFSDPMTSLGALSGNADLAYLLRAYAIHAWRSGNAGHRQELARWLPACLESFSKNIDPGPPGMTLLAAAAAGLVGEDEIAEATQKLHGEGYHLELACLLAALGKPEKSLLAFVNFQEQRRMSLLPLCEAEVLALDWRAAEAQRTLVEREALEATDFRPWEAGIQPV